MRAEGFGGFRRGCKIRIRFGGAVQMGSSSGSCTKGVLKRMFVVRI